MATPEKGTAEPEPGLVSRLAGKGEEAVHKVAGEAAKQPLVGETIERLEQLSRSVFDRLGIPPADEVDKLRKQVARLERRLKKLEAEQKTAPS